MEISVGAFIFLVGCLLTGYFIGKYEKNLDRITKK